MRIEFKIFGFLPVIYGKSAISGWGSTNAFFVRLPDNPTKRLQIHEDIHVKQFYFVWLLALAFGAVGYSVNPWVGAGVIAIGAIGWLIPASRLAREISAYGVSIAQTTTPNQRAAKLDWAATILSRSDEYDYHSVPKSVLLTRLTKRANNGKWF